MRARRGLTSARRGGLPPHFHAYGSVRPDQVCHSGSLGGFSDEPEASVPGEVLPGREWYRHMVYAPGLHTGYGVKTLPGLREAIEQRQWQQVDQFMTVIAAVLSAYSDRLDQSTAVLK